LLILRGKLRVVPPGYNPAAAMLEKPTAKREEARSPEVHEAALLLESARTYSRRIPGRRRTERGPIAIRPFRSSTH
jgi:hypothetical protein